MKTKFTSKTHSSYFLFLILAAFIFIPTKGKCCIDPDTVITVTTNYNADFTEIAIVLGNLKFMEEQPNVFCSCALSNFNDFFTNLEYVAFVETGTTTPYPNMEPWENTNDANSAWDGLYPGYGSWTGFIAEVINGGLGPNDDVELIIRASTPPGYFVTITQLDSTLAFSYLGTDAWSASESTLLGDHNGIRNLGFDNSSSEYILQEESFFTNLDNGIVLSNKSVLTKNHDLTISPNPSNGAFNLSYNLSSAAPAKIQIYNTAGQLIYFQKDDQQPSGEINKYIQLPKGILEDGTYFLMIQIADEYIHQKLVIIN